MDVLLHTDPHTGGGQPMALHVQATVTQALAHLGERVVRVQAHLSDASGRDRPGADDIQCTLDAQLKGLPDVVVSDRAADAHQAIEGALRKLERAVGDALAMHDPRHGHAVAPVPAEGADRAEPA